MRAAVAAIMLAFAVAVTVSAAEPNDPPGEPAEHPSFKLVQDYTPHEGDPVRVEFHFHDGQVLMVNEAGTVVAFVDVKGDRFYSTRHERMVTREVGHGWARGWRTGARARLAITDPANGDYYRDLLWPEPKVTQEEDGRLTVQTNVIRYDIRPAKGAAANVARAFAQFYALDALRNAHEQRNAFGMFNVVALSKILDERGLLPAEMTVTTTTPKGSATVKVALRVEALPEKQRRRAAAVAKELNAKVPAAEKEQGGATPAPSEKPPADTAEAPDEGRSHAPAGEAGRQDE